MDFIQSDMALGLAINNQNRLEVKGIFRGLRFYNGGEE